MAKMEKFSGLWIFEKNLDSRDRGKKKIGHFELPRNPDRFCDFPKKCGKMGSLKIGIFAKVLKKWKTIFWQKCDFCPAPLFSIFRENGHLDCDFYDFRSELVFSSPDPQIHIFFKIQDPKDVSIFPKDYSAQF